MTPTESHIAAHDGTNLVVYRFAAGDSDSAPALLMLHGLGEHGRRYDHVAEVFVRAGWNVIVPDLRGHGQSGGAPTHVGDFSDYVSDIDCIRAHFDVEGVRETVLLGHSMGGLIAARYAQSRSDRVSLLVMLAPLLRLAYPVNPLTLAVGRLLTYVVPTFRFRTKIRGGDLARNDEVNERRRDDPLLQGTVSAGWFFSMKAALEDVWRHRPSVRCPVLIVQGTDDRLVDPRAPEDWLLELEDDAAHYVSLPDRLHELLNEPDWQTTTQTVLDWLHARVPGKAGQVTSDAE